ncbi:MAG TPA: hypothetical protein VMU39_17385 [Solirubrobacteraceae bacterium]|nr:hypothetical protein [Solirubrobacteraceae bacterium]
MTAERAGSPFEPRLPRLRLGRLFVWTLVLRVLLAVALHFAVPPETFAPDQLTYDAFGRWQAAGWTGELPLPPGEDFRTGMKAYVNIVAAIYYLFGPFALLPKLLNCFIGALTVLVVHDVTLRISDSRAAALRAAAYAAFFPSLVLWSTQGIRDVWIVLLILLLCRQALILQSRPSPLTFAVLAAAMLGLAQFRAYVLFAVAGPIVVCLVVQRSRHVGRSLIVGSAAALMLIYADQVAGANRRLRFVDFEELNRVRYWNTADAASSFEQVDISSPAKALVYLPKGLALFLLAPFPWSFGSVRQTLALPEMLFFYALIPSIFRGSRHLARKHFGSSLMVLLMTAGVTVGYALGEGNAGTAYRHRAQVLCFFLIVAAVGVERRRTETLSVGAAFERQQARRPPQG